ncbi:hypothetical protein L1987_71540 [Smallanthus sonchifolius]|uniref:Uncharacterized protein n=1 Tax=Smallanthus sonchifolius TaxID=185202 RepID=A0ACB9ASP7_9ASTR|nr:hypothetical protein L1987_71540 [Smallanthus sonchifolius]
MASAILTSRNGTRPSDFMTNFTNNDLNFMRVQNIPNPNPNCNNFFVSNTGRDVVWKNHRQVPYSAPPQAAFIRPPVNSVPANFSGYRYVTFRLGSYTRRELKELKKRLMSDLVRVRILRQWICSAPMPKTSHHPPPLELPAAAGGVCKPQKNAAGQKRTNPLPPLRDTKKQCGRMTIAQKRKMMMRECCQILGKLMKHKHGWVFNTPVNAEAMKLYDYHNIIKHPMDLGTIKSKLTKNEYESPLAFASDVRLTFHNAMLYNGLGSHVFIMAERLLTLFEDMFGSTNQVVNQVKKQNRVPNVTNLATPIARVPKKPEMTEEEKAELAARFWNLKLGPEGMDQIMSIVKKGVLGLQHQGDEIELDLAVLDNDTLWGLHSFITNLISSAQTNHCAGNEHVVVEEEDVDIGEEMQPTVFPSIEIEKDAVNVSSSESSSDSESSSSDSRSGTCSGNSCNEQEVNSTPKVVS